MIKRIEEHYIANRQLLLKKLIWRCGTYEDAEDVLQNAYYRALKYSNSYDGKRPMDNWFRRILNHCVRDFQNARRSGENVVSFEEEEVEGIACSYYTDEVLKEIKQRIYKTKEPHREILILHFLHDYSPRDVSRIMDTPYMNTFQIINRFKLSMKEKYSG